eukprot:gb/GECH01014290.1/.p1 GENE.gb/GECH01014290.1/~~gb/GECH01014290.1/.p1  ORF type:complete len:320 (+),score=65.46 gb/GECH01014290.1/:1-960(+)
MSESSNSNNRDALRKAENNSAKGFALKFLAGGSATATISSILNGCDHVKVRLQVSNEMAKKTGQERLYRNFPQAFAKMFREEGFLILQGRGLAASIIREMSYSSSRMALYDFTKGYISSGSGSGSNVGLPTKIAAGGFAGAIGSFIANPSDLIKIRQQGVLPGQPPRYKHFGDAAVTIFRTEGIGGLYKGVGATVARAAVLTSAQLSSYDHTKHLLLKTQYFDDSYRTHATSSLVAGLCTTIASSPVDVIKTRYMNDKSAGGEGLYKSALDCFIKTVKNDGFRALYRGFTPNYIRVGTHCLLTLPLYEQMRKLFGLTSM